MGLLNLPHGARERRDRIVRRLAEHNDPTAAKSGLSHCSLLLVLA